MKKIIILTILLSPVFILHAQKKPDVLLNAKVVSLAGDTLFLSDTLTKFNGNLILVDYWASWCGPCLAEMPHSKDVQNEFYGQNLIFLYLNTDKSDGAWKRGLSRININGIHFRILAESKPKIQQAYGIRGIPYYQILGKNLELLVNGAAWPSYTKLYKQLRKYL